MGQPNRSNQGWPSWGWKPRRHAVHWVADQVVRSTTRKTVRICPQRIFVADLRAIHRKLLKETGGNEQSYKSLCARIVDSDSLADEKTMLLSLAGRNFTRGDWSGRKDGRRSEKRRVGK